MTAKTLFRIASGIFVLFAAGHTYGFLTFKPPTPEGLAAQVAMNNATFVAGGSTLSLGGFYLGFGLSATVSMLFSSVLAWQLGSIAAVNPMSIRGISWALFAVQVVSLGLALKYFGIPPMFLSAVVAACLGWASWRVTYFSG